MPSTKFRLAVCGGGVGGLMLARALAKYAPDVAVDIYESGEQFSQIGAGMVVWQRSWFIIKELGLDEVLAKMAISPPVEESTPSFLYRKADELQGGFNVWQMIVPYGAIPLHRPDLVNALTPEPKSAATHFNKKMKQYHQNDAGSITLEFADGTTAETDVLVGCDGLWSPTRRAMCKYEALNVQSPLSDDILSYAEPKWTGYIAYRALINTEDLIAFNPNHSAISGPMIWFGKYRNVITYPISGGRIINLAGMIYDPHAEGNKPEGLSVGSATREEVLGYYEGWEPEIQQLLMCPEKYSKWFISAVRGLPFASSGRVALLGDAAHAMSPHHGAGAGQAVEDAYILGRILGRPEVTLKNVSEALKVYEKVRLPFAQDVQERSRITGLVVNFAYPSPENEPTPEYLQYVEEETKRQFSWQWDKLPDVDWEVAEALLTQLPRTA